MQRRKSPPSSTLPMRSSEQASSLQARSRWLSWSMKRPVHAHPMAHSICWNMGICMAMPPSSASQVTPFSLSGIAVCIGSASRSPEKPPILGYVPGKRVVTDAMRSWIWYGWRRRSPSAPYPSLLPKPSHTDGLLTFPTLIQGGGGINVVPSICEAYGDTRLLPGLSPQAIRHLIEDQCQALDITDYRVDDLIAVPAVEIDQEAEIVQTLASSIEAVTGTRPPLEGAGPACDGWMFITRGIPAICGYGVRCGGVHGADEWADLGSLRTVTEIYARTIMQFIGEHPRR